jgi:hypothetical protein
MDSHIKAQLFHHITHAHLRSNNTKHIHAYTQTDTYIDMKIRTNTHLLSNVFLDTKAPSRTKT